ncbi:MAG: Fe-S cluster assembly protein SufD [Chlamydiae bacterium CG10_big_fil_rev_8_21_14_0_10_42_34]|nr:MAG: Fe-S cluster assembly protein SufD [Chlamydiae bacterium CG10_big_fil_rev_8_21_14_0_10_42_34]
MLKEFWADLLDPKDPLMTIRQKSWERFEEIGLPKPKQEAFQYVSKHFEFPKLATRKQIITEPKDGFVFVDGFFEEALSSIPTPLVCLPLDKAARSYGLFLKTRIAKLTKEETDPFAALNGAFQGRGAFLYLPPNCKAALHLTHIYTDGEMATPRLHIYLGRNAELKLTQNSSGSSSFSNSVIDFVLDIGANVDFCDHAEGHFQAIRSTVKRDGKFKAVFLGKKIRTSMKVQLAEENAQTELYGLACLEKSAESHIHANVEHAAPHTYSRQHFKSVLKDKSKFSFEGKIHVKPIAQKTQAYQLNNNLVLSDEASTNAKPNLEIFADDVKASHGATVGRLNEEELFYLRSRGLGLEQARQWLINGFCKEILDHAR